MISLPYLPLRVLWCPTGNIVKLGEERKGKTGAQHFQCLRLLAANEQRRFFFWLALSLSLFWGSAQDSMVVVRLSHRLCWELGCSLSYHIIKSSVLEGN